MKDLVSERIVLLAKAQECMVEITEKMDQWEDSQMVLEKSAFDCLNVSDKVLNLSNEGNLLVEELQECCRTMIKNPDKVIDKQKIAEVISEIHGIFNNITETSASVNEVAHKIEGVVAVQRDIEESIKAASVHVSGSIDEALACAEMMLAEL